jgi:hypothetical protein
MNDASEYVHAAKLLLAELEAQSLVVTSNLQKQLLHEMRPWLTNLEPARFQNFAILCFSAAENSLNQWRSYARGEGGFAIGLDRHLLADRAERIGGGLYPIVYDPDEQVRIIRTVLAWALEEYPRRAANYSSEKRPDHLQRWLQAYMQCLGNGAPLFKRKDFSEEQEWRIVCRIPHSTSVKFNPKQEILSAYLDLELGEKQTWPDPWPVDVPRPPLPPKLPIRRLWIGPGRYKDLSALSASALLSNNGYWGVELRVSDVPFRIVR